MSSVHSCERKRVIQLHRRHRRKGQLSLEREPAPRRTAPLIRRYGWVASLPGTYYSLVI